MKRAARTPPGLEWITGMDSFLVFAGLVFLSAAVAAYVDVRKRKRDVRVCVTCAVLVVSVVPK